MTIGAPTHAARATPGEQMMCEFSIPNHYSIRDPRANSNGAHRAGEFPPAERQAARILSLPNHAYVTEDQVRAVSDAINGFFG